MSTFSRPEDATPLAEVRPLASATAKGEQYKRSSSVQAEIGEALSLPRSELMAEAQHFQNETLVCVIHETPEAEEAVYACLLQELSKRITRLVRGALRGVPKFIQEEILLKVEMDTMQLVLAINPSRQKEFLEVAFARAVEFRALNLLQRHNAFPMGRRTAMTTNPSGGESDDFTEAERPLELVADDGPDPESIVQQLKDEAVQSELVRRAYATIPDPRQREAFILHVCHGWPIRSRDGKQDIVSLLAVTEGQAKYLIAKSQKTIEKACKAGSTSASSMGVKK